MFRYFLPQYGENLNIFMVGEQKQVKEKLTMQRSQSLAQKGNSVGSRIEVEGASLERKRDCLFSEDM